MLNYNDFLARKHVRAAPSGFTVDPDVIHPSLFDFQRACVSWALSRGCAALFEDTGLGKSRQMSEWAMHVARHTGGKVLILTPLAVAFQFITEAAALDIPVRYVRTQDEANAAAEQVLVSNYDRLKDFDGSRFAGVVLDESSILANYTGATKRLLMDTFRHTPYKLCGSATPAPNDWLELGNHAEFLGLMSSSEMITRWFINDQSSAGTYRLKAHAADDFWRWVASWAVCIGHPRDIGYDDAGYDLPPLSVEQHEVQVDYARAQAQGKLFPDGKASATGMWSEKRATLADRCQLAADLVNAADRPWVVWASTDEESTLLTKLIPGAIEVRGSQKVEEKEARLLAFSQGTARVIVTKLKIAGMGLNWQHCADMVFVSPTFSFKDAYQGIRRCYRFRQTKPVTAHFVLAETEQNISGAIARKEQQHRAMQAAMTSAMRVSGLLSQQRRQLVDYDPRVMMDVPRWLGAA